MILVNQKSSKQKKRICTLKRLKFGCSRKICCTKIFHNNIFIFQKCQKGKVSCPSKNRKWCRVILGTNGCKHKRCCISKKKYGKVVYKRCTTGKSKCALKTKIRCTRSTLGKKGQCHIKRCCQFTWSYRTKRWIWNKRVCKYQKRCPKKLIKCSWRKLAHGCAQRFLC